MVHSPGKSQNIMASSIRQTRSTRNKQVSYKETSSKNSKTTKTSLANPTPTSGVSSAIATSVLTNSRLSASRLSVNANRLSTSSERSSTPVTQKVIFEGKILALESRITAIEESFIQLQTENSVLRQTVENLQSLLSNYESELPRSSPPESRITQDQKELNANIIIRGIDVNNNTPPAELTSIYEGIRSHLGISDVAELAPVSVSVLPQNTAKPNSSLRPIKVVLTSAAAKVKFLQVRRIKKDIVQSDIGIANNSQRPVLITEQLTRCNQELLFQARSLREKGNFKFVWSKNGEVFARHRPNTKVINIVDKAHVRTLRTELNLPPLSDHGRLLA